MRIGGLASGMDIDKLVNKLMKAERMPLDQMQQESTTLTWKRDAFRDVNKKLLELNDMMLNMKLDRTYNSKSVSSSNESAVTATASTGVPDGGYNIEVDQLASNAINMSQSIIDVDPDKTFKALKEEGKDLGVLGDFTFHTYNEDGTRNEHTYTISEDDTLNSVLKRINDDNNNVRALFDTNTDRVIMETTRTGNYNQSNEFLGAEIGFTNDSTNFKTDNGFLMDVLNLKMAKRNEADNAWVSMESGGEDAKFKYNGVDMTSHNNSYELGGVNFQFKGVGTANLSVTNNDEEHLIPS